jgi:hypothetical protein
MNCGDDIIMSDGFVPDEEDDFDPAGYEAEFGSDGEVNVGDEEPADR